MSKNDINFSEEGRKITYHQKEFKSPKIKRAK